MRLNRQYGMENLVCGLMFLVCCSCSNSNKSSEGVPFPAGDAVEQPRCRLVVYFLSDPKRKPIEALDALLTENFRELKRAESLDEVQEGIAVRAEMYHNAQQEIPPPGLELLRYFGRGLDDSQIASLQSAQKALALEFSYTKENNVKAVHQAMEVAHVLVKQIGGVIWDGETHEIFSPEAWKERRLDTWNGDIPEVLKHVVIHAYPEDDSVRAVTLGMKKFGLPDVVVNGHSWSVNESMGRLIILVCQALVEGAEIKKAGEFDLRLSMIKHNTVRNSITEFVSDSAAQAALISIYEGVPDEGDPENRLMQIGFEGYEGPDIQAKQFALLSKLFGATDKVLMAKNGKELEEASKRARKQLPKLFDAFNAGLEPGEYIMLKSPFKTEDGGDEFMWIEVTTWEGDQIKGVLKSEPYNVRDLHAGQVVKVSQETVYDYLRVFADGRMEGNETSKIIERQQQNLK